MNIHVCAKFVIDDDDAIAYVCDLKLGRGKTLYVIKNVPTDVKRVMLNWISGEDFRSVYVTIVEFKSSSSSYRKIPWKDGVEVDWERIHCDDTGKYVGTTFFELSKDRNSPIDLAVCCPEETCYGPPEEKELEPVERKRVRRTIHIA